MAKKKQPETEVVDQPSDEGDLSHLDGGEAAAPPETTPEVQPETATDDAAPQAPASEEADDASETPKPEVNPELPKPKHPPGLRRRALAFGASLEAIDATSLEDLDAWVEEQAELREQRPQVKTEPKEEDAIDWGTDESGQPLTEKDVAPGIAKNIRKLHEKQKELQATLKTAQERERARQQRAFSEACDAAFESLGAKYEKVFGKGDLRDLPKNSKEVRRRLRTVEDAGIDMDLDSPSAVARKLKRCANELFDDLLEAAPKAKPATVTDDDEDIEPVVNGNGRHFTRKQWSEGATMLPTSRKPKPLEGDAQFRQAVKQWYRDNVKDESEEEQFEGMPD